MKVSVPPDKIDEWEEVSPLQFEYNLRMKLHKPIKGWHITVIEKSS